MLSAVSGIFGIFKNYKGIIRKKQIFLTMYTFSLIVFVVLFIILAIFTTIYPQKLQSGCGFQP